MNQNQIKLLTEIKKLVSNGKRHFKNRRDRNYLDDLANLGLSLEGAWKHILTLNSNLYYIDPKPNYLDKNCLTFKKIIGDKMAYIKIGIDYKTNEVEAECWSFHEDWE